MLTEISEASMGRYDDEKLRGYARHERHIPLQSAYNLRTLAGIKTVDGRTIKAEKLYRSDFMADIGSKDCEQLALLRLRVVTDFRSGAEQKNDPHQWLADQVEVLHRPIPLTGENGKDGLSKILRKINSVEEIDEWLSNLYRNMVDDFSDVYAQWLQSLLQADNYPQLYHCTAGKDRTGVATALLLKILGVADDDIMDDFLLSNTLSADHIKSGLTGKKVFSWMTEDINSDYLRSLLSVQKEFLEAAFHHIDNEYNNFSDYAEQRLKVGQDEILQLQALLLES